jgi:hypothetical protein
MKALKIELSNATAIEAELRLVNVRATAHSYTTFGEIKAIADRVESIVYELIGSKEIVGAVVTSKSAPSYKCKGVSTVVTLENRSTGWFLTAIRIDAGADGGKEYLTLTAEQDALALERLRKNYGKTHKN